MDGVRKPSVQQPDSGTQNKSNQPPPGFMGFKMVTRGQNMKSTAPPVLKEIRIPENTKIAVAVSQAKTAILDKKQQEKQQRLGLG